MIEPVIKMGEDVTGLKDIAMFWCEPCDKVHAIRVGVSGWTYNMDEVEPTFQPSILVLPYPGWQARCHSFVTNGMISYLSDCEHDKAGQEMKLIPVMDWPL